MSDDVMIAVDPHKAGNTAAVLDPVSKTVIGVLPVAGDDALVSLRLLCDRRDELTAQRTQAVCRLHRLLAELTPGGMRRELSANKAQALLARIRPADDVGLVRVHIARDHLADIRALDARIKYIGTQIAALVAASGIGLTGLFGGNHLGDSAMTSAAVGRLSSERLLAGRTSCLSWSSSARSRRTASPPASWPCSTRG